MCKSCKQKLSNSIRNAFPILLYLSGLNMMEGILNKEQLAKVPSKTKEAKLKIMGGDYINQCIQVNII